MSRVRRSLICLAALTFFLLILASHAAPPPTQAYTWKRVRIGGGGFVTGVVFHPSFTNVVYCHTDVGGAYRWNEAIQEWEPLLDWMFGQIGTEAIALDPTDPNLVYMTCGTDNWPGHDMFLVSSNRGTTWTTYTPPFGVAANNYGRSNGPRLMVDPNNTSILYYASRQGLYVSTNCGVTWSLNGSFPVTTTANGCGSVLVQFVKNSGTNGQATPKIFVGVSQTNNIAGGLYNLYLSTNAGSSWAAVNTTMADTNGGSALMPLRAALDGIGNLYVTFCGGAGPNDAYPGSVLKINVSNLTSRVVTPPTGQGGFAGVSVSQQNPNVVAVSTMDRWYPHDVIYLSTNGGTNWTDTTQNATSDNSSSPWMAWGGAVVGPTSGIGHWIGDCQIDPFNGSRLFYIGGGGMSCLTNLLSSSNRKYLALSTGIEEMGAGNVTIPSSGPLMYSFFWDIGSFVFYNFTNSPPATNHCDPIGSSNVGGDHAEMKPSYVARIGYGLNNYGYYSTNYGSSWLNFGSYPLVVDTNGPGMIAVSAYGSNLVWSPSGGGQFWSGDNGATWTKSTGGTVNGGAVSDRTSDKNFYVYDRNNGVFYTSADGGKTFVAVNSSMVQWANFGPESVFGRAGDVWLPTWNGLYHSTNFGTNWTQLLAGENIRFVSFGKAAPGKTYPAIFICKEYVANVSGQNFYRSDDGGTNWVRVNSDQEQWGWIGGPIRGDSKIYGRLYVTPSTYGNFYGDIASNMPANGAFTIVNRNSGLALDNGSLSMIAGIQMQQSALNSGIGQQWMLNNLGNGQVKLINQYSGWVLGVNTGATADGAAVIQAAWLNNDYQKWQLTPTDSGYYKLLNVASGKVLQVPGGSTTDGALLTIGTDTSAAHQQWRFASLAPTGLTATGGSTLANLSWTGSWGATSYNIRRATVSGGPYALVGGTADANTFSYTDTNLVNGITYYYVVTAMNDAGEGPYSNEASVVPAPAPTTAWYALENNALDSSGNGNNGTANNVSYVAGKIGSQAASFNGSSSYIQIPRCVTDDFTVMMWVKTSDSGNSGSQWWNGKGLVDGEVSGGAADWGVVLLAGKFAFGVGNSDTTVSSSATINNGAWHHVAATRNNTTGAMKVYVDGVLSGSITGPTGSRTAPPNLRIGSLQTGGGYLNGAIDDVRIYNSELSVFEISGMANIPPAPTGLTATAGDGQVALNWSPSSGATGYYVKRSTVSGSSYSTIATNSNVTFTNTGVTNGVMYFYVVSATNSVGQSGNSAEAFARPVSLLPPTFSVATSNGQIQFTWPSDHVGWQLQVQTNALAAGLGTNWTTVPGSQNTNQLQAPIDPANGSVFYRLKFP